MKVFLLFHIFAILFTLAIFIRGFFPLKNKTLGFATQKVKLLNISSTGLPSSFDSTTAAVPASYKRLVLMVIDAFRADFAFGSLNYFPKTVDIIKSGHGLQFIAKAHPPTVTLPRIKAITTGSTPSFVDIALNFGSPALEEDNIITQMKRSGRQIIFFGDDTWISLFPNHFERSDGTTSFYVSDYTEVDRNVSRHLREELDNPSWDVMILHYLGLDHIGHIAGPSSPLVKPKLSEMDNVISQIYTSMELWKEPSLLVVCGDHGMSDQGGHGGASLGEVSVPVLFLSPQIVHKDFKHIGSISQSDLCPTLSVLLGLPIPKNNLGRVITDVLVGYTLPQKVSVIHQNAVQAMQILKGYNKDFEKESSYLLYKKAKDQLHLWLMARNSTQESSWEDEGETLLAMYSESLALLADKVTRMSTQYDVYAMAVSMALLWMLLASLVLSHLKKSQRAQLLSVSIYGKQLFIAISTGVLSHITMCTGSVPSDALCQATPTSVGIQLFVGVVFVVCLLIIHSEFPKCVSLVEQYQTWIAETSLVEIFLLAGTVVHTFTLFSSSFVEEEHQLFYFFTTSVHLLLLGQAAILLLQERRYNSSQEMNKNKNHKDNPEVDYTEETFDKSILGDGKKIEKAHTSNCSNVEMKHLRQADNLLKDIVQPTSLPAVSKPSFSKDTELSNTMQHGDSIEGSVHIIKTVVKERKASISFSEFLHILVSLVGVVVSLRILRRWNQTGNKWIDIPDFGDWLILPGNKMYLSLVAVFSLMIIGASQGHHMKRVQSMSVNLALTTAYLYRVAVGSLFFPSTWFLSSKGIVEARASFFFIGVTLVLSILPKNFFKLESSTLKQELQTIEDSNSPIRKSGYVPILGYSNKSLDNQSVRRNLILKDGTNRQERSCEQTKTSGSVMAQPKMPPVSKRKWLGLLFPFGRRNEVETSADISIHQRLRGVTAATLCFMCLVLRPHNSAVVVLMSLVEQMVTPVLINSRMKPTYILLYCLWMGQAFFFFQGNSNSLSTLDLTTGYTGLQEFTPELTGTLLCLATYSGPIFWVLTYLRIVSLKCDSDNKTSKLRLPDVLTKSCATLLLSRVLPLSAYTVLVSTQRYHLFVWTVFSPKLLYEAANTFVIYSLAFLLLVYSLFTR